MFVFHHLLSISHHAAGRLLLQQVKGALCTSMLRLLTLAVLSSEKVDTFLQAALPKFAVGSLTVLQVPLCMSLLPLVCKCVCSVACCPAAVNACPLVTQTRGHLLNGSRASSCMTSAGCPGVHFTERAAA